MKIKLTQFHVSHDGAILDGYGAVLYDADCLTDLSEMARTRLAQLHTDIETMDWEHAAEILRSEGFRV